MAINVKYNQSDKDSKVYTPSTLDEVIKPGFFKAIRNYPHYDKPELFIFAKAFHTLDQTVPDRVYALEDPLVFGSGKYYSEIRLVNIKQVDVDITVK